MIIWQKGYKTLPKNRSQEVPNLSSDKNSGKKDANYWKLLNSAVTLDIQRGHLKWTITQLSKKSGISRTLIYYYFGSSKIGILKEAVITLGYELAGMSPDRLELWRQGRIAESLLATRKMVKVNPAILYFYMYNRKLENEIGKIIQSKEKQFQLKLAQFFPNLDSITYESIFAIFLGITWVENISENAVHRTLEIITQGINAS